MLAQAQDTAAQDTAAQDTAAIRNEATAAMRKAAEYYFRDVATHGGYVYFYSLDLAERWGEGRASEDQIWVQPPGTPTVGLAFLRAYEATGDRFYLDAATAAAEAIVHGQLASGGWANCIDFNPRGERTAQYRNGRGRGKNNSSLDDGQTQSAIRLLIHADRAHEFRQPAIHEAARIALDALLAAQFPNGGFPQVWTGPVTPQPIVKASYPEYDWRTDGRIKEYWNMYTLNDDVPGYVAQTLIDAAAIYDDPRYLQALRRLGDFYLVAQMPEPQPGWAQQYNYQMQPIWARKFEPPAVASDETQEAVATLMKIYEATGDTKYLAPIPPALTWLHRSRLPDGRLPRYFELQTNRPLYMTRIGDKYTLTYDDARLPDHYGWKIESRVPELVAQYKRLKADGPGDSSATPAASEVRRVIRALDDRGRWIETYDGERLVGQPKMSPGTRYLSSEAFSRNVTTLSEFLKPAE